MHYHVPKPFFRKGRNRWYVQLRGKQINLGPDKEEAFRQYYRERTVNRILRPAF